ncbi:MAG: type III polyketide synthase [Candidatus Methylacidiphilales bacterium]
MAASAVYGRVVNMMILHGIGSAVPPFYYRQEACLDALVESGQILALRPSSRRLLERVLRGDNGIEGRFLATESLPELFALDADGLNEMFRREAPRLGAQALERALQVAGVPAEKVDALFVCTCTGYLCPGVSSYVAEQMGLRPNIYLHDLVGLGCGAAIPMLRSVAGFVAAHPESTVACVAVELSSAAFYLDDDAGVLISACLFGDGASASIWRGSAGGRGLGWSCDRFQTVHVPEARDLLRFETRDGKLRNRLDRSVPELVARTVGGLWRETLRSGVVPERVLAHGGGRDVATALEEGLGRALPETREVLRDYGNMSSPSVLFAVEQALTDLRPDDQHWWLTSFGAGFAAHSCWLSRLTER